MKPPTILASILPFLPLSTSTTTTNITIDPLLTVPTTSGIYTGFVSPSVPDVHQWLGIRYGLPPTGSKRFLPPEPAADSNVHYYARDYKPICFQQSGSHTGLFWELVPEFQNQDPQGEDCLFLNVWAPRREIGEGLGKDGKLPVLIWACGGGLQEGGGHAPYQVPDQWVQRMKSHIVVTFNYRLNIFGFPGARGAMENAGFQDARLVVEWAKANIAGFGGDPEKMVIWGQSAGAGLVTAYLYANPSDPIVSGAIAMSGAATAFAETDPDAFSELAKAADCGGLNASAELSCMQSIPALRLQDLVQGRVLPGTNVTTPRFNAVADNVTVFANNTERLEKGLVATVPLITGYTTNENAAFTGYTSKNQTAPPPSFTGPGLECSVKSEISRRLTYNLPTYRYLTAGNFSNITPRYWLGAMHSSDLPLVFGTHYQFRGNSTDLEWATSFDMEDYWVHFAANTRSNPSNAAGLEWPLYAGGNGSEVVMFGGNGTASRIVSGGYADAYAICS